MQKMKKYLIALIMTMICITGFSMTAHAATKLVKLKSDTTYKCDVTADGKADTLKYTVKSRNAYSTARMTISINSKRYNITDHPKGYRGVWYYRTGNTNEYLLVWGAFMGGSSDYTVYHCRKTGLVKVGTLPSSYYTSGLVIKNGEIRYATSPKYKFGDCYLRDMKLCVRVKIANGKINYVSRYAKCYGNNTTYAAASNFYLVTGAGHQTINGVFVRIGQKVKFQYGYFRNNNIYYRVSVGGKVGWLPEYAKLKRS